MPDNPALKQTVVITIESDMEGDNASVTITFNPQIENDDQRASAAEIIAVEMLRTLQSANIVQAATRLGRPGER